MVETVLPNLYRWTHFCHRTGYTVISSHPSSTLIPLIFTPVSGSFPARLLHRKPVSCSAKESVVIVFVHGAGQSQHSLFLSVRGEIISPSRLLLFQFFASFVPGVSLHVSLQPEPCCATEQYPVLVEVGAGGEAEFMTL